jgi:hypothetical protein
LVSAGVSQCDQARWPVLSSLAQASQPSGSDSRDEEGAKGGEARKALADILGGFGAEGVAPAQLSRGRSFSRRAD